MHKIKKIIKDNSIIIFLLVAIAIVTNIVIVYTLTYTISNKGKSIEEINIKDVSQKSPIVVEVLDDLDKNNNSVNENQESYPTGNTKYYIKVNLKTQTVNIYEKDESNRYSKPVKTMLCSTGEYTPKSGTYKITTFKREWLDLQGDVYGQYCTQIIVHPVWEGVRWLPVTSNSTSKENTTTGSS